MLPLRPSGTQTLLGSLKEERMTHCFCSETDQILSVNRLHGFISDSGSRNPKPSALVLISNSSIWTWQPYAERFSDLKPPPSLRWVTIFYHSEAFFVFFCSLTFAVLRRKALRLMSIPHLATGLGKASWLFPERMEGQSMNSSLVALRCHVTLADLN